MGRKFVFFLIICLLISGCESEPEILTEIENKDALVSINYPVTEVSALDEAISSYINKVRAEFKNSDYDGKPELNISYTYKEVNDEVINVSILTEIVTDKTVSKIKTFTYNKKSEKFLTMEDIVDDLDVLDYDIKKELLSKYQDADMDYLSNVSYDFFTMDDENLTIYFNPTQLKDTNDELVYLDIPLDSLNLLIDVDREENTNTYLNFKKNTINEEDKVVALTFDDGPSKYTKDILDILKKYDACGTFFLIGNKVSFYGEVLREMLSEGNEIGNHSYDHKYLTRLSEEGVKDEISKTQDEIKRVTGYTPTLFRPTYGGYNNTLKSYIDLTFVLWDVDSRDWSVKSTEGIMSNVFKDVKSGSIILFHDNHEYSVNALPSVIKELKKQGYKFVTVSELLELKKLWER
ncbi:MAG TPA: polysaccharide deacetylase family protein [Candidatus Coprosoma intestinipullorum]|uniref:Polysaccharide deacetylase family protein n=1 Tax=Candidatus Coprosoma intestinipullorum TaxID=2840752 RepID=A0A9D0ZQS7_9FIRM|nr:polysaccharide deacetylase family protein [Candidatus Coprosoma intestinipullorum]